MDEGRKRVIGVMAAILAAQKSAQWDGGERVPATVAAIADTVRWAEETLRGGSTHAGRKRTGIGHEKQEGN
jgi:hypothetical protein